MRKKITLFLMDVEPLADPIVFETALKQVPPERKDKVLRFQQKKDRLLSLGAGLLLKKAVEDAGLSEFPTLTENEFGKPEFSDIPDLYFNLSHSGKRVAVAIGNVPMGVDIEKIEKANLQIADRFFRPMERRWIRENPEEVNERFYRMWTMKESFMKATGRGMKLSMTDFEIRKTPSGWKAVFPEDGSLWYFSEHGDTEYKIALCYTENKPSVTVRTIQISDCLGGK